MRSRLLARQASQTDLGILEFCLGILEFLKNNIATKTGIKNEKLYT